MKKGQKKWVWTPEQKLEIVHKHLEVLKKLAGKKNEEQTPQVVFHTDQGSVYSSQAFRKAHNHYNISRNSNR